jgi:hypothetical protein
MTTKTTVALSSVVAVFLAAAAVRGQAIPPVMTAKSLPPATVALIDPESGTSSGGGSSDIKIAVGDVVLFRFKYFTSPDGALRGLGGWLTEYVPPNTQVVGVRIVDANGVTILPNYPGLTYNGTSSKGSTSFSPTCVAPQTCPIAGGSLAQLYGDTGIFWTNDANLAKYPDNAFITLYNGYLMNPEADNANDVLNLLDVPSPNSAPSYSHNLWDRLQMYAFGGSSGAVGLSNTPAGYGSPVAGLAAHYMWDTNAAKQFSQHTGPWTRVIYPGSTIGAGVPIAADGALDRALSAFSFPSGDTSYYVNPAFPRTAKAIRYAVGELRAGEPGYVEVALKVTGLPLDPVFDATRGNIDCGELFGGNVAATLGGAAARGTRNPWPTFVPAPACVYLNLLFDIDVDKYRIGTGEYITYSLRAKNLSLANEDNVCVRFRWGTGNPVGVPTGGTQTPPSGCPTCPSGFSCYYWKPGTMAPSQEWPATGQFRYMLFDPSGGGHMATVMYADYFSNRVATGFTTQAMTIISPVAYQKLSFTPPMTAATAGSTYTISGIVKNDGAGTGAFNKLDIWFPAAGWTITSGGSTLSGCAKVTPPSGYTWNRWECSFVDTAFAPGEQQALNITLGVPTGTATGLYNLDAQIWAFDNGNGGTYDTLFPGAVLVPVGQARTDPPVVGVPTDPPVVGDTCGLSSSAPSISGTSEPNATIKIFLNGVFYPGSTTTADGTGHWSINVSTWAATFGAIYGGTEIRATATGVSKLESPLSVIACFPRPTRACSDGIDNDGDGLIDFPADPGCSSPTDNDETDVAECADGIDNDGNGKTDFSGADPGCSSAADPIEQSIPVGAPACSDGIDNDGDGLTDYPADPGCHSPNDNSEVDPPASSDTWVPARLLLVFDTSGSMNWNTCSGNTNTFTGGDGSNECPGMPVDCAVCNSGASSSCANLLPDDSRLYKVKKGVGNAVAAFGEVEWGLMRYHQRATTFACPGSNASLGSGGWQGGGAAPCGGGFNAGDLLVRFSPDNAYDLIQWMDGSSNFAGTPPRGYDFELRGSGTTPIAGAFLSAFNELTANKAADPKKSCRPYRVILVSDGKESCGGVSYLGQVRTPEYMAGVLHAAGFDVYVIGFATPDAESITNLTAIAAAGRTGGTPIFADDEVSLSTAIAGIVSETVLREKCNGLDDNCNGLTDEDFPVGQLCNNGKSGICFCEGSYGCTSDGNGVQCNYPSTPPAHTCQTAVTEICCNGLDDNCDGQIDEGCKCDTEICNGIDDNSDGITDAPHPLPGEGLPCGYSEGECVPGVTACMSGRLDCDFSGPGQHFPVDETCDCKDNNCNGVTDDGVTRDCFTCSTGAAGVGECRGGTQVCTPVNCPTVTWTNPSCAGQVCPVPEVCDGKDNDCDGKTDEDSAGNPLTEACYSGTTGCNVQTGVCLGRCRVGTRTCSGGVWGSCVGEVTPGVESCNNVDDDCDGVTDNITESCYTGASGTNGVGPCHGGTRTCTSGSWTGCAGQVTPVPETCNGQDDDCDGTIDNGLSRSCYTGPSGTNGVGACHGGTETCANGAWGACTGQVVPSPETCDDVDNDCNGVTDGISGNCYTGGSECNVTTGVCKGLCRVGSAVCTHGVWGTCSGEQKPVTETCNGLDDDCDGVIDNSVTRSCYTGPTGTQGVGLCHSGTETCANGAWGACSGQVVPTTEVCDNKDNDCDGVIDNITVNCYSGGSECNVTTGACVGRCRVGQKTCAAGVWGSCTGERTPTAETCNGLDDDCDGTIDGTGGVQISQACYTGPSGTQNVGICHGGNQTCTAGSWGSCNGQQLPETEVCDAKDNNCNGQTDENTATLCYDLPHDGCDPNTRICKGVCALGTRACVNGAPSATCDNQIRPSAELCNNLDDDCDGITDMQSRACYTGPSGTENVGPCHGGNQQCVAGNWQTCSGQVTPTPEVCDGVDNDCNGTADDGLQNVNCYPAGQLGCNVASGVCVGTCTLGKRSCLSASWTQCAGYIIPTAEVCNGLDDNCNGEIDEGLLESYYTGPAGTLNVGVCTAGTRECNIGNWDILVPQVVPTPEQCNGLDDDCDGLTDEDALGNPLTTNCYDFTKGGCDEATGVCTGICAFGTKTCAGGSWGPCVGAIEPTDEICDNLDNDCDGQVDENLTRPYYTGPTATRNVGECHDGVETCSVGVWFADGSQVLPAQEVCDNKDNDCNGLTDDGLAGVRCYEGTSGCDVNTGICIGVCQTGTKACSAGVWGACIGQVLPRSEECNCFDDDCDGIVDNPPTGEELPGVGIACTTVGGCNGQTRCDTNRCAVVCGATQGGGIEICNGIDDDCDDLIDEEPAPNEPPLCQKDPTVYPPGPSNLCAGALTTCTPDDTGGFGYVCSPGHYECLNGAIECVGAVLPQPEVCDGIDNDCDGVTDDGDLCNPGSICYQGVCVDPCKNDEFPCTGGRTCIDGASLDDRKPCANPGIDVCYCVSSLCNDVTCDAGWICKETDGQCHNLCDPDPCTAPLTCYMGQCLDCTSLGCPSGKICAGQQCIDDPCQTTQCPTGMYCTVVDGAAQCVSSCASITCPTGQVCRNGECMSNPCAGVTCPSYQFCDPETGDCKADPCIGQNCAVGAVCSQKTGQCQPDPCLTTQCGYCQQCVGDYYYMTASCEFQEGCGEVKIYAAGGCVVSPDDAGGWRALPLLALLGLIFVRRRRAAGGGR